MIVLALVTWLAVLTLFVTLRGHATVHRAELAEHRRLQVERAEAVAHAIEGEWCVDEPAYGRAVPLDRMDWSWPS